MNNTIMLLKYFIRFLNVMLLMTACSSCLTGNQKYFKSTLINEDYYFSGNKVLIQGRSRIPSERNEEFSSVSLKDASYAYISINKRREKCREAATENAHSKWLLLTRKYPADQAERILQLRSGKTERYRSCLDSAEVMHYFYDTPDSCRVSMLYRCNPADY